MSLGRFLTTFDATFLRFLASRSEELVDDELDVVESSESELDDSSLSEEAEELSDELLVVVSASSEELVLRLRLRRLSSTETSKKQVLKQVSHKKAKKKTKIQHKKTKRFFYKHYYLSCDGIVQAFSYASIQQF